MALKYFPIVLHVERVVVAITLMYIQIKANPKSINTTLCEYLLDNNIYFYNSQKCCTSLVKQQETLINYALF